MPPYIILAAGLLGKKLLAESGRSNFLTALSAIDWPIEISSAFETGGGSPHPCFAK